MDTIHGFLEKLASENNFVFAMQEHVGEPDARSPGRYGVLMELQSVSFYAELNEKELNSGNGRTIQIDIGSDGANCNDPDFLIRVRDAILQVASSVRQGK